jgi:hypothetical protein
MATCQMGFRVDGTAPIRSCRTLIVICKPTTPPPDLTSGLSEVEAGGAASSPPPRIRVRPPPQPRRMPASLLPSPSRELPREIQHPGGLPCPVTDDGLHGGDARSAARFGLLLKFRRSPPPRSGGRIVLLPLAGHAALLLSGGRIVLLHAWGCGEPAGTVVASSQRRAPPLPRHPPPASRPRRPPSSHGWCERTSCWCGEDTGEAEERSLSCFSVASGTVEVQLQVRGAGINLFIFSWGGFGAPRCDLPYIPNVGYSLLMGWAASSFGLKI